MAVTKPVEQTESPSTPIETASVSPAVLDKTEAPETNDIPKMAEISSVKYIGTADVKELSKVDLERIGVEAKADLVFNAGNDHRVSVSEINASTRDFLASQSDFDFE